jgi:hypothetical protein
MNGAIAKRLNLLRWKAVADEHDPIELRRPRKTATLLECLTGTITLLEQAPRSRKRKRLKHSAA